MWADFLLGRVNRVGAYRFNLFFTPLGVTSSGQLPQGLAWYLLRAPDGTPLYGKTRAAVYVKLPGMFFWTSVVPADPGGWRGTKIARRGIMRVTNQRIEEKAVGQFIFERVETVYKKLTDLSPKQRGRIDEAIRGNPERAAESLTIRALIDDERIRVENKFRR